MENINQDNITSRKSFLLEKFSNAQFDGEIALSFSETEEEFNILRKGVGIRDLSSNCMIKLAGKDVQEFLHRISTNDIMKITPFQKANTIFLNEKGRFIDRVSSLNFKEYFLLISSLSENEKLFRWIEKFIIMEEIKITKAVNDFCLFEILGPQAESFLMLICGKTIDTIGVNSISEHVINDISIYIVKYIDDAGLSRYWILSDSSNYGKLLENILMGNIPFDLSMIGESAYDLYRIKLGIPKSPNEINDKFNPHETKLLNEISFTKGCYIGQEVIARLETYDKVQRELKGILINTEDEINSTNLKLSFNGEEIGEITSFVKTSFIKNPIGLGIFKKKLTNGDSVIKASSNGNTYEIAFSEFPIKL